MSMHFKKEKPHLKYSNLTKALESDIENKDYWSLPYSLYVDIYKQFYIFISQNPLHTRSLGTFLRQIHGFLLSIFSPFFYTQSLL
jgi:hypothetical protein